MKLQQLLKEVDCLKEEVNEYCLLNEHMRQQIKEYFRIGLTYSSNALEGNTLTDDFLFFLQRDSFFVDY